MATGDKLLKQVVELVRHSCMRCSCVWSYCFWWFWISFGMLVIIDTWKRSLDLTPAPPVLILTKLKPGRKRFYVPKSCTALVHLTINIKKGVRGVCVFICLCYGVKVVQDFGHQQYHSSCFSVCACKPVKAFVISCSYARVCTYVPSELVMWQILYVASEIWFGVLSHFVLTKTHEVACGLQVSWRPNWTQKQTTATEGCGSTQHYGTEGYGSEATPTFRRAVKFSAWKHHPLCSWTCVGLGVAPISRPFRHLAAVVGDVSSLGSLGTESPHLLEISRGLALGARKWPSNCYHG